MCIAREAAGLKHDAAKTTGSRCGRIVLIRYNRAYVNYFLLKNVFSMAFLDIFVTVLG